MLGLSDGDAFVEGVTITGTFVGAVVTGRFDGEITGKLVIGKLTGEPVGVTTAGLLIFDDAGCGLVMMIGFVGANDGRWEGFVVGGVCSVGEILDAALG